MRYGARTMLVVVDASGRRAVIESEDARVVRSTVTWASLALLADGIF